MAEQVEQVLLVLVDPAEPQADLVVAAQQSLHLVAVGLCVGKGGKREGNE